MALSDQFTSARVQYKIFCKYFKSGQVVIAGIIQLALAAEASTYSNRCNTLAAQEYPGDDLGICKICWRWPNCETTVLAGALVYLWHSRAYVGADSC